MSFNFDETKSKFSQKMVVLVETTLIDQTMKDPIWLDLKANYLKCNSPLVAACLSVANSILTHKRVVFGLSKAKLSEMIRNDLNLPERFRSFDNSSFKAIRGLCFNHGLFVTDAKEGHYLKFLVKDPAILAYLNVDITSQSEEFDETEAEILEKGRTPKYAETEEVSAVRVPKSTLKVNKTQEVEPGEAIVPKKDYKSMSVEELLKA